MDVLARRRRTLGDDHRRNLQSAYGVATTLHALRAYPEAAELLEDLRARLGRNAAQKLLAGKKPKRRLDRKRR